MSAEYVNMSSCQYAGVLVGNFNSVLALVAVYNVHYSDCSSYSCISLGIPTGDCTAISTRSQTGSLETSDQLVESVVFHMFCAFSFVI
jgi:hypothetical protein